MTRDEAFYDELSKDLGKSMRRITALIKRAPNWVKHLSDGDMQFIEQMSFDVASSITGIESRFAQGAATYIEEAFNEGVTEDVTIDPITG